MGTPENSSKNDFTQPRGIDRVQEEPPPYRPSRQVVIAGSDLLQPLGHSGLDQFILEMGVEGLSAGREIGGLQGRATALADFAVKNPDALTHEGEPIGLAVVRRFRDVDDAPSSDS